jgi:hypothetical protein
MTTEQTGSIAGRVTDRQGVGQPGVAVTILRQDGRYIERAYTRPDGRFRLSSLLPGLYAAEVAQPSFLPYWRSSIAVLPGAEVLLDINLLSLAESLEVGVPPSLKEAAEEWKWVLRSSYPPRPILRFQEATVPAGAVRDPRERALRGTVQLLAGNGSHGFGQDPGLRTSFDVAYAWQSAQWLALTGSAGFERGTPAASLRAAWNRTHDEKTQSSLSMTVRQLFLPSGSALPSGSGLPSGSRSDDAAIDISSRRRLQSVTMGYEETKDLTESLQLHYGSLFDTMNFAGQLVRWSPFGRLTYTPVEDGQLTIAYSAASPRVLPTDWDPERQKVEQWLAIPQLSAGADQRPVLEGGRHLEARWEQEVGSRLRFETAAFYDSLSETALSLAFVNPDGLAETLLRDPFSDRYFLSGGDLSSPGLRAAAGTWLSSDTELIVGYAYAGTLEAGATDLVVQDARSLRQLLRTRRDHSLTLKMHSQVPWTRTRVIASYRWLPRNGVAPSDPYDRGMSQSDPYLNLFLLQPLPSPGILPGQFEAVADFNNLLAQGYVTVHTPGGGQGYLFPAARSFRGGFNFIF